MTTAYDNRWLAVGIQLSPCARSAVATTACPPSANIDVAASGMTLATKPATTTSIVYADATLPASAFTVIAMHNMLVFFTSKPIQLTCVASRGSLRPMASATSTAVAVDMPSEHMNTTDMRLSAI